MDEVIANMRHYWSVQRVKRVSKRAKRAAEFDRWLAEHDRQIAEAELERIIALLKTCDKTIFGRLVYSGDRNELIALIKGEKQ